jgi:tryptophanyl-tRNA synthetase
VAQRFNHTYGDTFVVPDAAIPKVGGLVMDLQDPTKKMSKSRSSPQGKVLLLEPPEAITKKIKRAVTDNESEVRYDREAKPGVANLLELLSVSTGESPEALASKYDQYGPLKADTAAAVVELLRPVQTRVQELLADRSYIEDVLAKGSVKAQAVAADTLARAKDAMGFLPRRP